MGGGGAGGGSTQITPRQFGAEIPQLNRGYNFQTNQENQYISQNPLFNTANLGALANYNASPGLLNPLLNQYNNYPSIGGAIGELQSQFGGIPGQLSGMSNQLGTQFGGMPNFLQSQFGGLGNQLQRQFGGLPNSLIQQMSPLQRTNANYLNPIIQSGGALNAQQSRDVNQATSAMDANQFGTGANQLANLGNSLLNRSSYEQQRYGTALSQMQGNDQTLQGLAGTAQGLGTGLAEARQGLGTGLAQAEQGLGTSLDQARAGLLGQGQALGTGLAGVEQGLRGQSLAQQTGLASGIQGLQTGGLNQLIGAGQAGVNAFSQTTNPMLSYLSNLFGENLQAQIAQAQINQQGNIANQNKSGGLASGGLSAISSIAPILAGI